MANMTAHGVTLWAVPRFHRPEYLDTACRDKPGEAKPSRRLTSWCSPEPETGTARHSASDAARGDLQNFSHFTVT
jgi:hypothetical protein